MLALWDKMFAVDPDLALVDYICVAMLIRIRWNRESSFLLRNMPHLTSSPVLESDYSHCLQLLLKYPAPSADHGPHTFVDDAIYLRDDLTISGGSSLVLKYTGKQPSTPPEDSSPTPESPPPPEKQQPPKPISPLRPSIARNPLSSPSSFIKQQGGMEAIFQGAARNVLERGERLGINRAVRDAVGEIRKNVQGLNEARRAAVDDGDDGGAAVAAMERRNRLLAGMLDDTIVSLRAVAGSDMGDKAKMLELVENVAARVQFVKVHLEDSSIAVVGEPEAPPEAGAEHETEPDAILNDTSSAQDAPALKTTPASPPPSKSKRDQAPPPAEKRPLPIPTRSTLAQSSFSWMLEPDESSSATPPSPKATSPKSRTRAKRHSGLNISRERNAFLFGEDVAAAAADGDTGGAQPPAENIFGMEPIVARKDPGGPPRELF